MISFLATASLGSAPPRHSPATLVRALAWPMAIMVVIHRVAIVALNGTLTDDFTTVYTALRRFLEGSAVYEQAYNHVDPLYLYNPGATMLLSPLGLIGDFHAARTLFILANAAAIIAALALLTRVVGHRLDSWLWPTSIALAFATESVTSTLAFTNINGLLLLALAAFLWSFLRGQTSNNPWLKLLSGLILGLAIVIKPQYAPLLALPVLRLEWRAVLGGLGIPALSNLIAISAFDSVSGYTDKLVPYLAVPRDYANSSWPGVRAYFQLSSTLYWAVWLIFAALVGLTLLALIRWMRTDLTLWALTTSGVIFGGIFFLSSLGQQYYSMWLFPMMFTAVMPHSVFKSWPSWLAALMFLLPTNWHSTVWPDAGRWLTYFLGTVGWMLLIVVAAATVAGWWMRTSPVPSSRHKKGRIPDHD